jgi:hypothetical protein
MELWKDIEGHEGLYQVSNLGRIKSLPKWDGNHLTKEKILKISIFDSGYLKINLIKFGFKKWFSIHRLVAQAFIPNPENKPEVNHKDGIKSHCYEDNLEWNTKKENNQHAVKLGLHAKGSKNGMSKLTEWDVKMIRKMYKNTKYWTQQKLADLFNVGQQNICNIINNRIWKHVKI